MSASADPTAPATPAAPPAAAADTAAPGAFAPLRVSVFRLVWIASLASNIGLWMQNVTGSWRMTELTTSAMLVALVQTASSVPTVLLGLPAGALSDLTSRRGVLIAGQLVAVAGVAGLVLLNAAGLLAPWSLLLLTVCVGAGTALAQPSWQAALPGIVPRTMLPSAVALNGLAINGARAFGPAVGGLLLAGVGATAVLVLNGVFFALAALLVLRWHEPARPVVTPAEPWSSAIAAGARYVRHAAPVQAVLARGLLFTLPAAALWGLLPVVNRDRLGGGSLLYGLLLACVGGGALVGVLLMPRVRRVVGLDACVGGGTVLFAAGTAGLGVAATSAQAVAACLVAGLGWIFAVSNLNVAVQQASAGWVLARVVGSYQTVFQVGLAGGSALWGTLAGGLGPGTTLLVAAVAGVASAAVGLVPRLRLGGLQTLDLSPWSSWSEPAVQAPVDEEHARVVVLVDYDVPDDHAAAFEQEMRQVRTVRLRDGAGSWSLLRDVSTGRWVEQFTVPSWAEHLRQHSRTTTADAPALTDVMRLRPQAAVRHLVASSERLTPPAGADPAG